MVLAGLITLNVLAVAGMLLLARGLIGRRINDHPICAGCGFDLVGVFDPSAAQRPPCPECGRPLNLSVAIRHGARVRRPAWIVAGAVLLAATLGPQLAVVGVSIAGGNFRAAFPTWALILELSAGGFADRNAALLQLDARLKAGTVDRAEVDRIVAVALEAVADERTVWNPAWGAFVVAARGGKMVSDADYGRFLRLAASPRIEARKVVVAGGSLAVRFGVRPDRAAAGQCGYLEWSGATVHVGDVEVSGRSAHSGTMAIALGSNAESAWALKLPSDLEARTWPSTLKVRLRVTESPGGPALAEWELVSPQVIEVRPAGSRTVEVIDPAEHQETFERLLVGNPQAVRVERTAGSRSIPAHVSVVLDGSNLPVDAAFEVVLRSRGDPARRWSIGHVQFRAGQQMHYSVGVDIEGFDEKVVDVLLEASGTSAERTVDLVRYWGGTVVVPAAPVVEGP